MPGITSIIARNDHQTMEHRTVAESSDIAATSYKRPMTSHSGRIDDKLACAAVRALQDGNLTPIIKEELRLTIQSKRLKKGQDELLVTFTEPTEERLTQDETERRRRRRENNKLAAQKCRAKRRERAEILEREAHMLESQNNQLRDQILTLERERNRLHEVFSDHVVCAGSCASSTAPDYASSTAPGYASNTAPDSPEVMDLTI